ncbi:MAG: hypothetical protein LKJ25_03090 [Clostridia bacterium]|jgi:hypothetical protein|nr:hypothetical protein [Clostridia bacterium]
MDKDISTTLLLTNTLPAPEKKEYEVKRLSKAFGKPFKVELKQLSYSRMAEIRKMKDENDIQAILASMTVPDMKNEELLEKFDAVTPAEAVKKIFIPGEISDLFIQISKLSGYMSDTVKEIKKN